MVLGTSSDCDKNKNRPYKCCTSLHPKGCKTATHHIFELPPKGFRHKECLQTPLASSAKKLTAVVLDCEMAGTGRSINEVVMLCAVDYTTGVSLINALVQPDGRITDMRTDIHGIKKDDLDKAVRNSRALLGWKQARAELWKYIDADTILIGHSLHNDLDVLRMIHNRVVDSEILTRNVVGIPQYRQSLSHLCKELLGIDLRGEEDDSVHTCMDDVMATRELVLYCTQNTVALTTWAAAKKVTQLKLMEERREAQLARNLEEKKRKAEAEGVGSCDKKKTVSGRMIPS